MLKYTTGEIAKLCSVSVRTVQYYDSRGILVPTELSEGGRRIYSEEDLRKMKIICFLRELDLPINSIGELLSEEYADDVITKLLGDQERTLHMEILEKQSRLNKIVELKKHLKKVKNFSTETIGDVANIIEYRKKLRKVRIILVSAGIAMDIMEITTFILGLQTGVWWPLAAAICVAVFMCIWIFRFYYKTVSYICPQCHVVFKPSRKECLWAKHTPSTRKLTCTACGYYGFCMETYSEEKERNG